MGKYTASPVPLTEGYASHASPALSHSGHSSEKPGLPSSGWEAYYSLGTHVEVSLEHNMVIAMITLIGPDVGVWFGVGFGAKAMKDQPYDIIVDGCGRVTERKLANHGPGTPLSRSVEVVATTVHDDIRTLVLHRHFNFPTTAGDLNLIAAVGDTEQLVFHTGGKVTLIPIWTSPTWTDL